MKLGCSTLWIANAIAAGSVIGIDDDPVHTTRATDITAEVGLADRVRYVRVKPARIGEHSMLVSGPAGNDELYVAHSESPFVIVMSEREPGLGRFEKVAQAGPYTMVVVIESPAQGELEYAWWWALAGEHADRAIEGQGLIDTKGRMNWQRWTARDASPRRRCVEQNTPVAHTQDRARSRAASPNGMRHEWPVQTGPCATARQAGTPKARVRVHVPVDGMVDIGGSFRPMHLRTAIVSFNARSTRLCVAAGFSSTGCAMTQIASSGNSSALLDEQEAKASSTLHRTRCPPDQPAPPTGRRPARGLHADQSRAVDDLSASTRGFVTTRGVAMADIKQGRWTAEIEGDFVVFIIGARLNSKWQAFKSFADLGGRRGMNHMLKYLTEHPEKGLLGYETMGFTNVQYWRSFEHLEAFAKNTDDPHLDVWRSYWKRVGKDTRSGIWHETYLVRSGEYEAVYGNMPAHGLGKASRLVPIAESVGARQRLKAAAGGSP